MFTLEIKTDNAAFRDDSAIDDERDDDTALGSEIATILRRLADHIEGYANLSGGSVQDTNGNTVGRYTLT